MKTTKICQVQEKYIFIVILRLFIYFLCYNAYNCNNLEP